MATTPEERERQQLEDVATGIGWSTDKTLARYFSTTMKTVWYWAKEGKIPQPKKNSANMTRWNNVEIKAFQEKKFIGGLYGE